MNRVRLLQGDILTIAPTLPPQSVHTIITSPPYWGLRDYGIEPTVWPGMEYRPLEWCEPICLPGDIDCDHEWGSPGKSPWANKMPGPNGLQKNTAAGHWRPKEAGPFCRRCDAWCGTLGLEPSIPLYVGHLVLIFRELRRVLRDDGTLWLNLGDSYSGSGGAGGDYAPGGRREGQPKYSGTSSLHGKRKTENGKPSLKGKDLCGSPWAVAQALRADGWWLRSDIIWSKPNPMPESCTDRPTRAHEYIFLLTKSDKYFYDAEAVKEIGAGRLDLGKMTSPARLNQGGPWVNTQKSNNGRNLRNVWNLATHPFPEAHFATFPPALVECCLKAGTSEKGCCPHCGAPWRRVVEKIGGTTGRSWHDHSNDLIHGQRTGNATTDGTYQIKTIGWLPTCHCCHSAANLIPPVVLDPFSGAGTTGLVSAKLQRDFTGIEIKPEYVELARRRITRELGMLVEVEVITH